MPRLLIPSHPLLLVIDLSALPRQVGNAENERLSLLGRRYPHRYFLINLGRAALPRPARQVSGEQYELHRPAGRT